MLILLDIDGVLVPANSWKKPEFLEDGFPEFSIRSVKALQRIISEMDANLMLTTSHKSRFDIPKWHEMLKLRGIDPKHIDRLDSDSLKCGRKKEIMDWYDHRHIFGESFVIIDDDKMLNDLPEPIRDKLILTSPSVGLTDELATEAIAILKNHHYQIH